MWYYTNSYGNLIDCSNANGGGNPNSGTGGIEFNQWSLVTATRQRRGLENLYNSVVSGAANKSGSSLTARLLAIPYIGAEAGYSFNSTIAEACALYKPVLTPRKSRALQQRLRHHLENRRASQQH